MAWSLQWYKNSLLAWMWNQNAQQAVMSETPWFNMFANTNQTNVPWMDILSPAERHNQEYDSNAMRAEALNKEVEIWLWSRIDPVMSDSDKQRYLNSLTKNQYNQMLKYKNEWYWFMASKELLENSYKLADPNATWLMKYKDYADKDAYYNNSLLTQDEPFVAPTKQLADWWNERYSKNIQYWTNEKWETYVIRDDNNFWNRLANVSFGSLVNLLDTWVSGMMNIMDKWESAIWSALDRAILWYDTDYDFYRKSDTTLINDVVQTVSSAASLGALWLWVASSPLGMAGITAFSATKPWEFVMDLTYWNLNKLVNRTLDKIDYKDYLNNQSLDSAANAITLWLSIWLAKVGWPKIQNSKIWAYSNTIKWMVKEWLKRWTEYAKIQADFENFSKTKWWTEREDWTFVETENYNPWYRGRVASEFWEWFKEWVKEKFNNPNWTNLSEIESTTYQEVWPWTTRTTWWENVNKTNTNNTQYDWIVNTIWASQLRQWNKMNKVQWIKFANRYWTDYWTWMAQRGFNQSYDNNINQLIDYDKYMQNQKRQALWTITQRYREPAVDDMLLEAINRAEYIKSDDLWKLQNLALKNEQWWLTPADIDYVRQRFWYNFPLRFDGTDIAWTTQRNNNMYMRVKDVLERIADENWIPQLRDINREIAATHHIIEWTTRYYNWLATNDIISLKDLITLASTVANPNARPLFIIQQAIKMPKVKDAILSKLIKGKTTEERNQIKIDFDKIRKIQNEAEQRRMLEEWIAKWNLKVEEATKAMQNRLPENITQWGVSAWDRWFMATYWDWPTYQELWLWKIRETASPQFLLRAIIEQLKEANLIKDINVSEAINQILANLSPEAQAKLAQIADKLANWRELTPEEWKVVEKLADIIRQDQDTITDVQQPWLFDWLDNWEPTDINNTNLPTNPTNNAGGITDWWNPQWWGISWWNTTGAKTKANDWANWWGNKGGSWEWVNQLWTSEGTDWTSKDIVELDNVEDAYQLIDGLIGDSKYRLATPSERWQYRTFTNGTRDAVISIDWDWKIVEFIQSQNAQKWAADELLLHAIDQWWNKIDIDYGSIWLINKLEKFWFYALSKAWYWDGMKVYLAHNWEPIDVIKWKIWNYALDERLSLKKRFDTYKEAEKYRDDFIKDNTWYELTDEKWWDWLKNYKDFNKRFKTQSDIKQYVDDTFKDVDSHVTNDIEDIFDKTLAMVRQAYNWNKSTKDLSIVYALLSELPENVVWRYFRPTNTLTWAKEWFTFFHEFIHYSDYFWWKELTGSEVELSTIANQIKNRKRPKNIDTRAELIWDFAEIFKEIDKWAWHWKDVYSNKWYEESAREIFARWWEAFYSDIQWKWLITTDWETFPRKISTMFAKWLWKVNIARENWELYDGTLQEISNKRRTHVTLSIPWVWNIKWMKIWILKDGTVWVTVKPLEKRWFHWSPATFDKFDSTHMWEWEWAQAHWWGHYIAIEERTWKHYANMGKSSWLYKWEHQADLSSEYGRLARTEKDYTDRMWEIYAAQSIIEDMKWWLTFDEAKSKLKRWLTEWTKTADNHLWKKALEVMDWIKEEDIELKNWRNLYEVEIPDPIKKNTPTWSNYLEESWDITTDQAYKIFERIYDKQNEWLKPIKEATLEDVRKIWEAMQKDFRYTNDIADRFVEWVSERLEEWYEIKEAIRDELSWFWSMSSKHDKWLREAWIYQEMERTWRFDKFSMLQIKDWRQLYNYLSHFLWWPKPASEALKSIWYDWIHYYWGRDWEAYVIFDDDAIDITNHRYLEE